MGNKHTRQDLAQMQSLPLDLKLRMTKRRIEELYDHFDGDVYLSFSGGKDSTVLKHIIDSMGLDIKSVFVNTGLEYPEIVKFVKDIKAGKYDCFSNNVEIIKPSRSFKQVLNEFGYPIATKEISKNVYYAKMSGEENTHYKKLFGTFLDKHGNKSWYCCDSWAPLFYAPFDVSHKCCDCLKKEPFKRFEKQSNMRPIYATMAQESRARMTAWIEGGCNSFDGKSQRSAPISFWTEQDVLMYLKNNKIPISSIYGEIIEDYGDELKGQTCLFDYPLRLTGAQRTGCMFCLFGIQLEKNPNRLERLKVTHPQIYDYCMRPEEDGGLGYKEKIDWINENIEHVSIKY